MADMRYQRSPFDDHTWLDRDTGTWFSDHDIQSQHYALFKEWLDAGGVPDEPDKPPVNFSLEERVTVQVQTTTNTPTELWRFTSALRTGYDLVIRMIAVDSGNGAVKKQVIDATIGKSIGAPSLVGRTDQQPHVTGGARATESNIGTWTLTPSFDNDDLVLTVVGASGRNIDWHATITMVKFAPEGILT